MRGTAWVPTGRNPRNKYRAQPVTVDGIRFASKREASRWKDLAILERVGEIRNLQRQVSLACMVSGIKVCTYVADFVYVDQQHQQVVEDAKGVRTPIYKLKKRLVRACLGIEIREV